MKKVLVLCPTAREYRDLPAIARALGCELVFDHFGSDHFDRFLGRNPPRDVPRLDIVALIEQTIARHRHPCLAGVTSGVGYPGMSAASVIAKRLGLPGPSPEHVLCFEHKYYSRLAQKRAVPEAVPQFRLLDPRRLDGFDGIAFPAFLKPVKSCMSINAWRVHDAEELRRHAQTALLPEGFVGPFNDLLRAYSDYPLPASYVLAESLLEGMQVSLEGYVYRRRVHVMGILDAIMFPGTISFRRFQYPSHLNEAVQARMADIARRVITGIGYDNAPFNVELMYNARTDAIHVIEVNPKIASQFTDLFLKVDGTSSYAVLLQLALGEEPVFTRKQGEFSIAGTCVLRTFQDQHVLRVPSTGAVAQIVADHPDALIEVHATPGMKLSDQMQDAQSFRYGLVNIGANSEAGLEQKFECIARRLDFGLVPVQGASHVDT